MSQPENEWADKWGRIIEEHTSDQDLAKQFTDEWAALDSRAPATTPTGFDLLLKHYQELVERGCPKNSGREVHTLFEAYGTFLRQLRMVQAAAPGGKEPREYDQCHSNSPFCEKCGICHTEKFPCPRASYPLQASQPIPESLERLAKEIAEEFCGGSEAVEDAILAKLLASHPLQDKPPEDGGRAT